MKADLKKEFKESGLELFETYSLQGFSPIRSGGVANYFVSASSTIQIAQAIKLAGDQSLPYIVVGRGSRSLFSDNGYPGLVIENKAQNISIDRERSQMIVDSGCGLSQIVTQAAAQGLGGIHGFYSDRGTVGGAIYSNTQGDSSGRFLSVLRSATVVLPKTSLKEEPVIRRHDREWFLAEDGLQGSLQIQNNQVAESDEYQVPVILTAVLQLTSIRQDDVFKKIQNSVHTFKQKDFSFGPIFYSYEGDDHVEIGPLLAKIDRKALRKQTVMVSGSNPNYLIQTSSQQPASADEVKELIQEYSDAVWHKFGLHPVARYDFVGLW